MTPVIGMKRKNWDSVFNTEREIEQRIQLANGGFAKMKQPWYYKQSTIQLKLRIYTSYILPLLTYNMGTWAMTKTLETKLDIAHRNHLRKLLKVNLLDKVPNNTLYTRTNSLPLSTLARQARW